MDSDTRCTILSARIMANIGAELSRRMLSAGFAPDCIFEETRDACAFAAYRLDRLTRAAHEAECGDETEAGFLLDAANHFRRMMLLRLPDDTDLRILPGDTSSGVEIIVRGEPHDYRP